MNVVIKEEQFKISNIYYTEPIQNIIMDNSQFIKIVYSNQDIMMSGIFLLVELKHITKESYFKKIKITYDTSLNKNILKRIYEIENQLLQKYNNNKNLFFIKSSIKDIIIMLTVIIQKQRQNKPI